MAAKVMKVVAMKGKSAKKAKAVPVMKKTIKVSKKKGVMKKTIKKISVIARGKTAKSKVFSGAKAKTQSGLEKKDLIKNKNGKVVSKKASEAGKRNFKKKMELTSLRPP